jgi:hypothetical protein
MNDLATLQRALDELDSGLPAVPDLNRIRRAGLRRRRLHRSARGIVGAVAVVGLSVAAVPSLRSSIPFSDPGSLFASDSGGAFVTLSHPGWNVGSVSDSYGVREVQFTHESEEIEVDEYPASQYDSYVADRSELDGRRAIQVLGQDGTMWTYTADDHTVIRSVQDGHFVEIRGSGMNETEFRALLDDLVLTDQAGFAQSMPDQVVTPENRDRAIARLLQGVDVPPGFTAADVRLSGFNDAYQASAHVAGSVGCAWIDLYDGGSASQEAAAITAFDGSRHWPLLVDIADLGGYSSVFWSMADRLRALSDTGGSAASLKQGLC